MKRFKLSCEARAPVVVSALLICNLAFAAPLDSSANSCTFVDVVVNQGRALSTEKASNSHTHTGVGAGAISANQGAAAVASTAFSHCDVMYFSTPVARASGSSNVRAISQQFQVMATIFEDEDEAGHELDSIFNFSQPTAANATPAQ